MCLKMSWHIIYILKCFRDTEEKTRNLSPALLQQAQAIQFLAHLQSILLLNPGLQAAAGGHHGGPQMPGGMHLPGPDRGSPHSAKVKI